MLSLMPNLRGRIRSNASLAKMCWFGVGGEVAYLFQPADTEDLVYFIKNMPANLSYFVFGVGSNIIIRDSGYNGIAIRLGRGFNYISHEEKVVRVGGAVLDLNVALFSQENSISGLEFLSGIPGTIGGAIAMNAGAYGKEIADILLSVKGVNAAGEVISLANHELGLEYRKNKVAKDYIFIEATFVAERGNQEEIARRIKEIQVQRGSTQPVKSKTGGSTFKNPVGKKAWQLIDEAGCRGLQIGGAQVSEMHCNFFINTSDATAQDLIDLIQTVKDKVFNNSGIMLEEEIKIVG